MQTQQGYYAVIPANVRYSKAISDGAKLLYGEITALCDKSGYCWASNAYFADLYGASKRTVSRWISELSAAGFIATIADDQKAEGRKIWLSEVVGGIDKNGAGGRQKWRGGVDKNGVGGRQKWRDPHDKNVYQNTTVNTTVKREGSAVALRALEAEKFDLEASATAAPFPPVPAAPLSPGWNDRPNTDTPERMREDLQRFYEKFPADWQSLLSNAGATYTTTQRREIVTAFCAYQIENNRTANTYRQTHAALQRWFIGQKTRNGQSVAPKSTITRAGSDPEHYRKPQAF